MSVSQELGNAVCFLRLQAD